MRLFFFVNVLLMLATAAAAERELPVRIARVEQAEIQQQLSLTGMFTARRLSNLSSRVDALVTAVKVEEGDFVERGETLIVLDKVMAEYQVKRAEAALTEAKVQLQESIRLRDELGKLIKNQYLAKSSYEASIAEVRMNSAVVKRLAAELQRDKEQVSRHFIIAPFAGVIGQRMAEAGQWLKVGDPVMELVDIDTLRIEVDVPQRYYAALQNNTPVAIAVDALPGQTVDAAISYIIPVASAAAHTFPVYIEIDNTARRFVPGMTVRAVFHLSPEGQPVLLVPRDAVVKQDRQQDTVWLVKQASQRLRAYPVAVKTGRVDKKNIEILGGELQPGDQVVIRGNEILKSGQAVRILH